MTQAADLIHIEHLDLACLVATGSDDDICPDCLGVWLDSVVGSGAIPKLRTDRDMTNFIAGLLIGIRSARIKDGAPNE